MAHDELDLIDAYWRAANYLTVGQIYLMANPLLREPLQPEHIKPRLLGHWGTSPALSLVYAHLNRLVNNHDADVIYLAGPGHGGPAVVANVWLESSYSEVYPDVSLDTAGMAKLFKQFSTPGGIPSHVSVPTPGSIHEGGELGYVLSHAFGAAFDNPDLIVAAVVGDGEAETGPLAGAWQSIRFTNARRDGAVLPILSLNGHKISGPAVWDRVPRAELDSFLAGHGYEPLWIEGDQPREVHELTARVLDDAYDRIRNLQEDARNARSGTAMREPRWPAIVLRTPKGWTGPEALHGRAIEGTFRAHQVPLPEARTDPEQLAMLEAWMRSYRPEELFEESGRPRAELMALAPKGPRRMSANPHANGGLLCTPLNLPSYESYAVEVPEPATERLESTRRLGVLMRDIFTQNRDQQNFRLYCPDETNSNRLGAVFDVENRCLDARVLSEDDHVSPDGRVMEVLSEHLCQGWLEGYLLTGRHGLFASYEAFAMVSASMTVQHAKWLEEAIRLPWRAPVPSLNILLTSTCWRNDHNGFSHQGPGLIDVVLSKKGSVARIYLPPDANCLLSVADHCFRSRDYVNLIVIDKQPQLQWLDMEAAKRHCAQGASVWEWCSNDAGYADVVLACAGDIPTQEVVAAAWYLRHQVPDLRVRVVNVVNLMSLFPADIHPHGLPDDVFEQLFGRELPVVFAFHGYQRAIHQVVHGRPDVDRFHVRGFVEEGTTTTPFDMVVRNEMSRYHLAIEAIRRSRVVPRAAQRAIATAEAMLERHHQYVIENLEDMPEVRDWVWSD